MDVTLFAAGWGCIPELTSNCQDMTNTSSTYFSIAVGAVIGGIISWWIYIRQKKTSLKQDMALKKIEALNDRHDAMLKRIELIEKRHADSLRALVELNERIQKLLDDKNSAAK